MELEQIFWARQRWLKVNYGGRISALEDRSSLSSQRSGGLWQRIKQLAAIAGPIISFLARHWGVITLLATATWAGLRWLLRMAHIG